MLTCKYYMTDLKLISTIFFLCLGATSGNSDSDELNDSEQWIHTINRDGLVTIDDSTYNVFVAMELKIREYFNESKLSLCSDGLKDSAYQGIITDEDVLFYWEMLSINWEGSESNQLLQNIVRHYITVRGFSFTSGIMEKYKQSTKKCTQKTKRLRKTIDASRVCLQD